MRRAVAWVGAGLEIVAVAAICAGLLAPPALAMSTAGLQLRPLVDAPRLLAPRAPVVSHDLRARAVAETLRTRAEVVRASALQTRAVARAARPVALSSPQRDALEDLRRGARGPVEVSMRRESGTPRLIRGDRLERAARARAGRDPAADTARAFLRKRAALLKLDDPDAELALQRTQHDALGRTQLRFGQRHGGLRVWPAELIVHLDPSGDVDAMDGASVATPTALGTNPTVAANAAVAAARAQIAGAADAQIGTPELLIYTGSGSPRLAWKVFVPATLQDQWWVIVDAHAGVVVNAWNTAQDVDFLGTGTDALGAGQSIHVWKESEGNFFLVDTNKAMFNAAGSNPPDPDTTHGGIVVLDAGNQPPNSNPQQLPTLFHLKSATGAAPWLPQGTSSGPSVGDGVSALVNLSRVYDYFLGVHGRNSLDDAGGTLIGVVRLGLNFPNAFFLSENNIMAFGDAEKYAGALDVVAHELTHGVTHHSANLIYKDESGALNEAFSDIFGEMVEAHVAGAATPDWLVGSPPAFSTPARNMQNPGSISTSFGPYPSKYSQRIRTSEDNGGVHLNSSIVNHAFYQLVQGLPNAIGRQKAQAIFYRALTAHLTASANFVDARIAAVTSAQELSALPATGITAADVQAVRDAFTAVEVFDGPGTEPPAPFPGTAGSDATLFVRFDAGANFLGRREIPSDGAGGKLLSFFDVKAARPAVLGDGSEAVFVDSINGLCSIRTEGTEAEFCDPSVSGVVSSIAVSPDGNRFSFVLRNLVSGDPENEIYVFDDRIAPPNDLSIFSIEAPAIDAATIASILFADQMDFSADGRWVVFDALTQVDFLGSGAGAAAVRVWAIYAVDLSSGSIFTIVPPERGIDIGYPSLAQTSDNHIVFDVVDQQTGNGAVLAGNLDTGALAKIADLAGTPAFPAFGIPSYTGSDDAVIFSQADPFVNSGVSLEKQGVAADRITPSGAQTRWLDDADFGVIYRRGVFVPEPAPTWLVACAWGALALLARRRRS